MAELGRPQIYTQELADKICEEISTSNKGLRTICKELGISTMTVLRWLSDEEKKDFRVQYARAKEEQADHLAEEILEIADDSTRDDKTILDKQGNPIIVENTEWTKRSQLRVDARKWIASKLKPKKYGDKLQTENKTDLTGSINISMDLGDTKPNEDKL